MQPRRKYARSQADGRFGQGVGDDRLNRFTTIAAPVTVDDVLRDNRLDALWDVFNDTVARLAAFLNGQIAIGAGIERMILLLIDRNRGFAMRARVPRPRPFGLTALYV